MQCECRWNSNCKGYDQDRQNVQLAHCAAYLNLVDSQAKHISGRDHPSTEDEHSSNEVLFDEQLKEADLNGIRLITVGSIQKAAGSRGGG